MIAADLHVSWHCDSCGSYGTADLPRIAAHKGLEFSLIGRRTRCRTLDCSGRVGFRYASSAGTPSRPLRPIREEQDQRQRAGAMAELELARRAYNALAQELGYPLIS